jgi:alpha-tubulin suppressor-like RCC1 family protein
VAKATEKIWVRSVLLGVLVIGLGCSGSRGQPGARAPVVAPSRPSRTTLNGLVPNGLSTNGLWGNGLWGNGLWGNGLWGNGLWGNGLWGNGLTSNGLWGNGLWGNGLWGNGLWGNGLWGNGLWGNGLWGNGLWGNGLWGNGLSPGGGPAADGSPAQLLQSSRYLRQFLQYLYQCAMPGALDPITNAPNTTSYDTFLDPWGGTLTCTPSAAGGGDGGADAGSSCPDSTYTCSPQGTCVVPLHGGIGLAINADGSAWWGVAADGSFPDYTQSAVGGLAGACDESCQRWISACVLARTNAYGVHVEISMRAPANAPAAVKNALAPSPSIDGTLTEMELFNNREGAYYGNIFETTPVPATPPSPNYSGQATGAIVQTPIFTACAGPESNVPEITRRFESSQGDQVVISVPGLCVGNATDPGVCAGLDTDSTSQTYGSVQHCYTKTSLRSTSACATMPGPLGVPEPADPTCFDQVITVYLATPIAVCGNGICEPPLEDSTCCPTDCHPATWAKDFSPLLQTGSAYQAPVCTATDSAAGTCPQAPPVQFAPNSMSAVAPDSSIAVVGSAAVDICASGCPLSLGSATLPASAGAGVLVKYAADGSFAWPAGGVRFGSTPPLASVGPLQSATGVIVGTNAASAVTSPDHVGNITVAGVTTRTGSANQQLWISSFLPDGTPLGTWIPQVVGNPTLSPLGGTLAFDSSSNLVLGVNTANPATGNLTNVTSVALGATGADGCAVLASGAAVCWGRDNSYGQLGNGTFNTSSLSVPVVGLSGVTSIAMGDEFACALLSDGTVECWGQNSFGQLGIGSTEGPQQSPQEGSCSTTPVPVIGLNGPVTAIAAAGTYACALLADTTVQCWGSDPLTFESSGQPATVPNLRGATSIAAGPNSACAIAGGAIECWGSNIYGALGNGSTDSGGPVVVSGIMGATAVSVGLHSACAVLPGGTVSCWGDDRSGQLGNGTTDLAQSCAGDPCSTTPVPVTGLAGPVVALAVAYQNPCAILGDGTVQCWGYNATGELGIGTTSGPETCFGAACSTTPVTVGGLTGAAVSIATAGGPPGSACAVLSDGTMSCWGAGQSSPTPVGQGPLLLMKTALLDSVPAAPVFWMTTLNDGGGAATFVNSLAIDPDDNLAVVAAFAQSKFGTQGTLHKVCADGSIDKGLNCPDGSFPWATGSTYSAATVDAGGNIYAGAIKYLSSGVGTPFVTKYDTNGANLWQTKIGNSATAVCPVLGSSVASSCMSDPAVQGVSLGLDGGGNVVMASFGNPAIGGGLTFGPPGPSGPFPTFPTYGSPNIFLSAYDPGSGSVEWVDQIQTILWGSLHGMALGNQGQIVVAGNYSGSMQVDGQLLVTASPESPSVTDSFLASFAEPTPLVPTIGSTSGTCGGLNFDTVPADIWVPATSSAGACVFFMPPTSAWSTTVTCSPAPNTTFPIGSTPVTCTAYDAFGNSASTPPFNVHVFNPAPPVIASVPANITRTVAGPTAVTYATPIVLDQLDNPGSCSSCAAPPSAGGPPGPPPPCVPPPVSATCTPASGSTFPLGTTTVSCTTTDAAGRSAAASFTVTLLPQVNASCVGAPGAPVIVATPAGTCGVQVSNATGVAGSCSGAQLASCTFNGSASETLGLGDHTIPVVATASDLSTTQTCTSYIRVVDKQNPVLTCPSTTIECSGNGGASVTPTATCTDNCSCTASCASGFFPVGSSLGSCSASDPSGNSATCQPNVKVVDSIAPSTTATVTPNPVPNRYITINITSYTVTPKGGGTPVTGTASCWTSAGLAVTLKAADACALKQLSYTLAGAQTGSATVASGSATINVTKSGSTTVSYFATDKAGNAEPTKTLPLFVGTAPGGQFGFSCAPSPSLKNLPPHGTVTAKGTVSITNSKTGKTTTASFSFTQSY